MRRKIVYEKPNEDEVVVPLEDGVKLFRLDADDVATLEKGGIVWAGDDGQTAISLEVDDEVAR